MLASDIRIEMHTGLVDILVRSLMLTNRTPNPYFTLYNLYKDSCFPIG